MRAAKALGSLIGTGSFGPSLLTDAIRNRTPVPRAGSKNYIYADDDSSDQIAHLSLNMTCTISQIDRNGSVVEY